MAYLQCTQYAAIKYGNVKISGATSTDNKNQPAKLNTKPKKSAPVRLEIIVDILITSKGWRFSLAININAVR